MHTTGYGGLGTVTNAGNRCTFGPLLLLIAVMPFETIGYHTCDDTEDIDKMERDAPFRSRWKRVTDFKNPPRQPFLSEGFYFWEQDLESAHWWGQTHCNNKYVVFRYNISIADGRFLDLIGNVLDKRRLHAMAQIAISGGLSGYSDAKEVPYGEVLTFVRALMKERFPYDAVRGTNDGRGQGGGSINRRPFASYSNTTMIDNQQFILCLFRFSAQTLYGQTVLYPSSYVI